MAGFWGTLGKGLGNMFGGPFGGILTTGLGLLLGGRAAKGATNAAMQRSPEELAALQGATGVANKTAGVAGDLLTQSRPYIAQPANYFSTLLSGNRAAMSQAVAPAAAQITGNYRGAERGLEHSGVRGAARDYASGELNRQRVSDLAALTTGVQPAAATALAGLGTNLLSHTSGLLNTSGNIYSNLLRAGTENRVYGREQGAEAGSAIGKLIADLGPVLAGLGKKKTGTTPGAPNLPVPIEGAPDPNKLPGKVDTSTLAPVPANAPDWILQRQKPRVPRSGGPVFPGGGQSWWPGGGS